ncbi:TPA: hypothetical protein ACGOWR_001969 [Streptococcus suis]
MAVVFHLEKKIGKKISNESSIMKLATDLSQELDVSLYVSKLMFSFDNRLEAVRLVAQG